MKDFIHKINNKEDLTLNEMQEAINLIMSGMSDDEDIESFLIGLNEKGVSETEVTAAAIVMKEKSLKFDIGDGSHIDTCGTGGTGLHTFNCSTASSLLLQLQEQKSLSMVIKQFLANLVVQISYTVRCKHNHEREKLISIFDKVGFVFLFAPLHHEAMKFVMPVRQKIAEKTIFNLLGPHTNPCSAKKQVLGVYDEKLVKMFSNVAKNLDMKHVMIVHGDDGLDEISICSETIVSELKDNKISEYKISPKDYGLNLSSFDQIAANSSDESLLLVIAHLMERVLLCKT